MAKSVWQNSYRFTSTDVVCIDNVRYKVYDVPGDGNCFFHCLSLFFNGDFNSTQMYRNIICRRILEEWVDWREKVSISHGDFMNYDMYTESMLNNTWWASATEIEMASCLFTCGINIWLKGETVDNVTTYTLTPYSSGQHVNFTVNLLLVNNHFMVLNEITSIDSDHLGSLPVQGEKQNVWSKTSENDHSYCKSSNVSACFNNLDPNILFYAQPFTNVERSDSAQHGSSNVNKRKSNTLDENLDNSCELEFSGVKTRKQSSKTETPHLQKCSDSVFDKCRKLGLWVEEAKEDESKTETKNRLKRIMTTIRKQENKIGMHANELPSAPPLTNNPEFDKAMDCIRAFELEQMSYSFNTCIVCNESKVDMKTNKNSICRRCCSDKEKIKMFSSENKMNPGMLPSELDALSVVEQQLIARISPCMNVHMLKHGGIGSSGHCITFPQEVNEPAQIFPRLPHEIEIIKVRKQGQKESSKDFRVRRSKIETALKWLQRNNPAYIDIIISKERLNALPEDGQIENIHTAVYNENTNPIDDKGPAPQQTELSGVEECTSASGVLFPDHSVPIKEQVQNIISEVIGKNQGDVTQNKHGILTIPWPARGNIPLSEFTTQYFFTLAFPCLFPHGSGDFHINRPRTCKSMSDWADHLLWFKDGRFAKHKYFKFVVHNMVLRKSSLENGGFIVKQKLGDSHLSVEELKEKIHNGDHSIAKKILYFSDTLRGTSQYWNRRSKELQALVQYKINKGEGLPSFFTTGSCAEFHFKPLRRLISLYVLQTTGKHIDFSNHSQLFEALQENTHIVAKYFDMRTQSYFSKVMAPVFGVDTCWYRQEFAKSRGMIHWHGLCWRHDREPHNLIYQALQDGLSDDNCAQKLAEWAHHNFGITAEHPAGTDSNGNPKKDLWPPPEGTAPAPPEDKNPLVKLLMDVSSSQSTLLEDYLLLTKRFNLHRCSDYCLKPNKHKKSIKECRMEFGTENNPGKQLRKTPALVKDKNGSLRLEMARDHPMLVQHSRIHTQGWRANGDISIILSRSSPENPSVNEILATEKYITGYACKGNHSTEALSDLFNDMVSSSSNPSATTAQSLCTKYLMNTVKRDVSAVEASFELSSLPLYRCSHTFQSVSLSGYRVFENDGKHVTKNTALDQYLNRDIQDKSSFYTSLCNKGKVPVFSCSTQASWPLQDEYSKNMLILHWPNWRKLSDIKGEDNLSWTETFQSFLSTEVCPNFVKADVERAQQHNQFNNTQCEDQEEDIFASQQSDWMELMKPVTDFDVEDQEDIQFDDGGDTYDWTISALDYPNDLGKNFIEGLKDNAELIGKETLKIPQVNLHQMNKDQLFAFNIVMSALQDFSEGQIIKEPLRMIVTGTAGSGKSFLIKCIVKAVRTLYKTNKAVEVICPTGNSANIIGGVTLHSFLKIPTFNCGKEMTAPEGALGDTLQSNLGGLKVLLVDERSLIGVTTLGWMEFMCRYGTDKGKSSNKSWGGLPVVVFFGDDVQLPPVCDSPVYCHFRSKTSAALHGAVVWQEFKTAVMLTTIVRQNETENKLRDVLLALRQYKTTPKHCLWLQSFQWSNLKVKFGASKLNDMETKALFVFPSHKEVWEHNKVKLKEFNETYPVATILAVSKGTHATTATNEKSGLLKKVHLCKNAKVMITVNLAVQFGLFNGALGTVVDIIYSGDKRPPKSFPEVVMVRFEGYSGPPFLKNDPKVVPIVPVERQIDCVCQNCKRKQIPLLLAWATTIHKCQGMTVGEGEYNRYIVISPGTRQFESKNPGALFVALSRAKSTGNDQKLPDFAWHPSVLVNQDRICYVVKTPTTIERDKEISRITKLAQKTKRRFRTLLGNYTLIEKLFLEYSCEE